MSPSRTLERLRGGDLRSTGAADEVARDAATDPHIVADLFEGLRSAEPIVRMRSADALEKASRKQSEILQKHKKEIVRLLDPTEPKEVLWHAVQMAPRISYPPAEIEKVFAALQACLAHESSIVKTSAMQALCDLLPQAPQKSAAVRAQIETLSRTGTPAMKARGKKLLQRLV